MGLVESKTKLLHKVKQSTRWHGSTEQTRYAACWAPWLPPPSSLLWSWKLMAWCNWLGGTGDSCPKKAQKTQPLPSWEQVDIQTQNKLFQGLRPQQSLSKCSWPLFLMSKKTQAYLCKYYHEMLATDVQTESFFFFFLIQWNMYIRTIQIRKERLFFHFYTMKQARVYSSNKNRSFFSFLMPLGHYMTAFAECFSAACTHNLWLDFLKIHTCFLREQGIKMHTPVSSHLQACPWQGTGPAVQAL